MSAAPDFVVVNGEVYCDGFLVARIEPGAPNVVRAAFLDVLERKETRKHYATERTAFYEMGEGRRRR